MTTTSPSDTAPGDAPVWFPWVVAKSSRFQVADPHGEVCVVQMDATNFEVLTSFRFVGPGALADLRSELTKEGKYTAAEIEKMIDDATTFPAHVERTDLASIPQFMRWFTNTYGVHTLAAIIHDRLIRDSPNSGALGSDTLSDRLFRRMLEAVGVPFFKRWIMWTAVAMRSRWAAKGYRRATLLIWVVLATFGLSLGFYAAVTVNPLLFLLAAVLPALSAPLWGKQWGASLVAAVAVPWILPAAAVGIVGYVIYTLLETIIDAVTDSPELSSPEAADHMGQ